MFRRPGDYTNTGEVESLNAAICAKYSCTKAVRAAEGYAVTTFIAEWSILWKNAK